MSRTLDAIWRARTGQQPHLEVPDPELNRYALQLQAHLKDLRATADKAEWQEHYANALEVCRISRRVRFRFADLDNCDYESRARILGLLSDAVREIRPDADMEGVQGTIKSLDAIRSNIQHRIVCIDEDRDNSLVEKQDSPKVGSSNVR